ncbi:sensor histidine kinase [Candidatus Soleaferrea massiliensis]|uniref:sensor histidine kinase n=1 Tax=Candidatus Soleaferrea massiliensis TaxID=1470354 RepID=UPI00058ED77C|nr:ATP-binding protein [Candidatus Soleaferrea massiliensis]
MKIKERFNTITKKSILMISAIGIAVILLINMGFPAIFYEIMKPHFSQSVSSVINACAVRQSYIWRSNSVAYRLSFDEAFHQLVADYDNEDAGRDALYEEIQSFLPVNRVGYAKGKNPGAGAITSTSYNMVYTEEGDSFYIPEAAGYARVVLESGWLKSLPGDQESASYSPVLYGEKESGLQALCFAVPFDAGGLRCYAVHIMNFAELEAQFGEMHALDIDDYLLLCEGEELYRSLGEGSQIDLDAYPAEMYEGLQYETRSFDKPDGIDFMVLCSYEEEDFRLAVHVPKETLLLPYSRIFLLFQLFLCALVLLLLIMVCFTLRGILSRLTRLDRRMNRVRQGDYNVVLLDKHTDEIGNLACTFNMMLQTIKEDIRRQVEHEKKEQQMQYSLLVSAIDPHFVYNTLNTITFLAKMNRNDEIVEVNNALIGTLKDRLTMKNCKTFDSVKVEKEVLEQYMLIQRCLCHNQIDYRFIVSKEDEALQIPKNILQPLVENALQHGILPHKDPQTRRIIEGSITITVTREQEQTVIRLADNGVGMDKQTIEKFFVQLPESIQNKGSQHIGVHNVRMRLSYLYGDRCRMRVESAPGEGTRITIVLP